MVTRMIKTNDGLFHVEVNHSRYGWIRISDAPLPHADAQKACKRAEKWGEVPERKEGWLRKAQQYLSEVETLQYQMQIEQSKHTRKALRERQETLIEYIKELIK